MSIRMCLSFVASVCAVAVAPLAAQPQQTPAGAQSFIKQIVGQGGSKIAHDFGWGMNLAGYSFCPNTTHMCSADRPRAVPSNLLISARHADSVCVTVFEARRLEEHEYDRSNSSRGMTFWTFEQPTYKVVDWGKVAEVKQSGPDIWVRQPGHDLKLTLGSDALAARMAFAMDFLRQRCDRQRPPASEARSTGATLE